MGDNLVDLSISFCGVRMKNPTVLSAGILGTDVKTLKRVVDEGGAGAVTFKSIGLRERNGYRNPTLVAYDWGLMNAVGLPTPGCKNMEGELSKIKEIGAPAFVSISGNSIEEYREVAKVVVRYDPAIVELNVSCPHTGEVMLFGCSEKLSGKVVAAVKRVAGSIPVMPKLTPQASDIASIARACEKAGADAIAGINTVGPGTLIDIEARRPVLDHGEGGISGPAILPIAVNRVGHIYKAVKVPILGIGGIQTGGDAIQMIQAGASAVGIGSGVHFKGIDVFRKVCSEMKTWMRKNEFSNVKELVGIVHEQHTRSE